MSFSDFDVARRTRKGSFLNQIDHLIGWKSIEEIIGQHYAPASDVTGRPAYPGLFLYKMLLVGIWHGGLSDEAVEDMANANLYVMRFLGLSLEGDVPDHSVLSRFRTRLTAAQAWDDLLAQIISKSMRSMSPSRQAAISMRASRIAYENRRQSRPTKWSTTVKSEMMNPQPRLP